jgi:hypothetical protein
MASGSGSERCGFCGDPKVVVNALSIGSDAEGAKHFCSADCVLKYALRHADGLTRKAKASKLSETLSLDELLEELRDVVLDASPEDLDAMKLRYDALHREAVAKVDAELNRFPRDAADE